MTKKDYELIARSIFVDRERTTEIEQKRVIDYISKGLAEQFSAMNPRFDSVRFLKACGVIY